MRMRYEGKELRTLVKEVKNHKQDRRRRGMMASEVFGVGTLIVVETRALDYSDDYPELPEEKAVKRVRSIQFAREDGGGVEIDEANHPRPFKKLFEASRPVKRGVTKTMKELSIRHSLDVVVMALIQEGYLSIDAFEKMAARTDLPDEDPQVLDYDAIEARDRQPVE